MQKDSFKLSCTTHIEDVETAWRQLQESNLATVYQDFNWVSAWLKNLISNNQNSSQLEPVFITVHDAEKPVALFPMCIRNKKSIRILSWLADGHFNYQSGLFDQGFLTALDEDGFLSLWKNIENLLPAYHVLRLTNQPSHISDIESPFRWIERRPSPNSSHQLIFEHHNWDDLLKELRSKSTRKRMRNEESRLSREGNLRWKKVDSEDQLEYYLDELFRQREARFKLLGIELEANPDSYKDFYIELLKESIHDKNPFVSMMVIELDDVVLATILLAEKDEKIYPLINSMTSSEYRKWSPGDYLLRLVIQDACEKKSKLIDFGLSEDSNYKTAWCNNRTEIFESIKGKGPIGKITAGFINSEILLKRKVKQSPKLWSWYCAFRSGKLMKLVK